MKQNLRGVSQDPKEENSVDLRSSNMKHFLKIKFVKIKKGQNYPKSEGNLVFNSPSNLYF